MKKNPLTERRFYQAHWGKRKGYGRQAKAQGIVLVRFVGSRMQVTAPYSDDFVKVARRLKGRWRKRSEVWSFPESVHEFVLWHIHDIYGECMINKALGALKDYGR